MPGEPTSERSGVVKELSSPVYCDTALKNMQYGEMKILFIKIICGCSCESTTRKGRIDPSQTPPLKISIKK
jgi:hypothetical protein